MPSRSMEDVCHFGDRVCELHSGWRNRAGRIRHDSADSLLIDALPAAPVPTVSTAEELVGGSFQAGSLTVERLVKAGVLVQVGLGDGIAHSRRMNWSPRSPRLNAGSQVQRVIPERRRRRAGYLADSDRDSVVNTDRSNMPGHQPNPDRIRHCHWVGCRFGPVKGTCRDIGEEVISNELRG